MPADIVTDASKSILDVGVVGAICLLLMIVLVFRERWWQSREQKVTDTFTAELKTERAAHDKTRETLLAEVRSNGEATAEFHTEMRSQREIFNTLIGLVKKEAS